MTRTVLILGARGRFGRNASDAFAEAGWTVRHFDRNSGDLARAAWGADVIVNAWNPAYTDWAQDVPELTRKVIEVAGKTGATVIIPGNVYVFGAATPEPWSERSRHAAGNLLGRIRVEMEAAYRAAGIRTIVLRAGDFIDTRPSGNWFDMIMTKPLAKGRFTYPGNPDIAHAWAYLPDMARATVALAEKREELPAFADIPFPGYTLTGNDLVRTLTRITGRDIRLRPFPYWQLQLARPFWRMAPRLLEMRYLWETPHRLDGTLFRKLLPEFRDTPLEVALASGIAHIPGASIGGDIDPHKAVAARH